MVCRPITSQANPTRGPIPVEVLLLNVDPDALPVSPVTPSLFTKNDEKLNPAKKYKVGFTL